MKFKWEPPRAVRLKLEYDYLPSSFAFKFNLWHYGKELMFERSNEFPDRGEAVQDPFKPTRSDWYGPRAHCSSCKCPLRQAFVAVLPHGHPIARAARNTSRFPLDAAIEQTSPRLIA